MLEQSTFIGISRPASSAAARKGGSGGVTNNKVHGNVLYIFFNLQRNVNLHNTNLILEHFSPFGNNRQGAVKRSTPTHMSLIGNLNPIMFDVRAVDFYWHQQAS